MAPADLWLLVKFIKLAIWIRKENLHNHLVLGVPNRPLGENNNNACRAIAGNQLVDKKRSATPREGMILHWAVIASLQRSQLAGSTPIGLHSLPAKAKCTVNWWTLRRGENPASFFKENMTSRISGSGVVWLAYNALRGRRWKGVADKIPPPDMWQLRAT